MDAETSWFNHYTGEIRKNNVELRPFVETGNRETAMVPAADSILPDDLLERILSRLPVASIFRAGLVSKRWREIVTGKRFLTVTQKPWYFMFTSSDGPVGHAYDPVLRKWHGIEIPCIEASSWFVSSSNGLVCVMDNERWSEVFVCNPVTNRRKKLPEPLVGARFSDYNALAISANPVSGDYKVIIVISKQIPDIADNFFQWDLSIHVYDSEKTGWVSPVTEVLTGWRGGDEAVVCGGVLYVLIYSTGNRSPELRHGLIAYDLSTFRPKGRFIEVPFSLTCGRLMNLKERLVMVGGIGKHDRADIIKGIGIWVLSPGGGWSEISRMPHKLFQGFGELDDVFASGGADDLVYIQSYGGPALLVFDVGIKQWKWSQKCPVTKRFPLQLFTGFCFEPRLEISP